MRYELGMMTVAVMIFLYGFIPWDSIETPSTDSPESVTRLSISPETHPPVSKLILVVIDAWRFGFFADRPVMRWMREQVQTGRADLLDVLVSTPTVTLPRIQALTSGSIPSFASVLLNFGGTNGSKEDTWLHALNEANKKIVFYGDDTWLSLYAKEFTRAEGVTSFFVKDFTEVDNNVTRNVEKELMMDWDVMILHYLGLDHIGHSLGGNAPEIDVKLEEMDQIISRLHEHLQKTDESYALLVLGDHGMTEAGGHGGSSAFETHVPLFLIDHTGTTSGTDAYKYMNEFLSINQVDITNLISNLLGVRVPKNSISMAIENSLKASTLSSFYPQALIHSAMNIARLYGKKGEKTDKLQKCVDLFKKQLEEQEPNGIEKNETLTQKECEKIINVVKEKLIKKSSSVRLGTALLSAGLIFFRIAHLFRRLANNKHLRLLAEFRLFLILVFLHFISYFSSSLIEEEHDLWFFFLGTTIVVSLFDSVRRRFSGVSRDFSSIFAVLFIAFAHRICVSVYAMKRRRNLEINGTYPKVGIEDPIWLTSYANFILGLSPYLHVCLPFCLMLWLTFSNRPQNHRQNWILIIVSLVNVGYLRILMPLIWVMTPVLLIGFKSPIGVFLWVLALSRDQAEISIVFLCYAMGWITKQRPSLLPVLLPAVFFYTGNTNSLASIDIVAGYTGLNSYMAWLVGLQIVLHTYAGPIAVLCGYSMSPYESPRIRDEWFFAELPQMLIFARFCSLFGSFLSLMIFSEHLFIWSVFGPKTLYEICHSVVFILIYVCYYWMKRIK